MSDIQKQLDDLAARVSELERQRWEGPPRLGPQPVKPDVEAMTKIIEAAKAKMEPPPPVDRSKVCTTSGEPAETVRAEQTEDTGQHKAYIVLCEEERKKGFVRPYRDSYKHVGAEQQLVTDGGEPSHKVRGGGCGTVTTMGRALSETYARDPGFYGSTFCCGCNAHHPVDQFVWTADGQQVGS